MRTLTKRRPATARAEIIQGVILCVVYLALGRWLAVTGWMSVLLSPSGNPPFGVVAVALAYILLRLFVLLALPGLVVVRLWNHLSSRGDAKANLTESQSVQIHDADF
ncbi:MAG: hypothetical protein JWQ02_2439 [Capsulimonas sp.]|nr:hypothetical protein [Capsulimonas sp.]